MQVEGPREREQRPLVETETFSGQKNIQFKPVGRIGKFSEHHRRVIKNTMQKGGTHFSRKSFLKRAARRKITIPYCKNRFLMVLFVRVERFFNDFPHTILN